MSPAAKLQVSLELFEHGCAMMRATLRRRHPELDEAGIEALLGAWLRQRPGAEHGDGVGRVGVWPRVRP